MGIQRKHCKFVRVRRNPDAEKDEWDVKLRPSSSAAAVFINGKNGSRSPTGTNQPTIRSAHHAPHTTCRKRHSVLVAWACSVPLLCAQESR